MEGGRSKKQEAEAKMKDGEESKEEEEEEEEGFRSEDQFWGWVLCIVTGLYLGYFWVREKE